jgi:Predicted membrane protein
VKKQRRNIFSLTVLFLKGLCIGLVELVPGVSGGTIAFVSGVYEELLSAIKSLNLSSCKLLFSGRWKALWQAIHGTFLLFLVGGMAISVFSLSEYIPKLIHSYPIAIWSFFMGLILASAVYILKDVQWTRAWRNILLFLVGLAIGFAICRLTPMETPTAYWFIFLSGAIAICALLLPGVSGSFMLLLLGKYAFILDAVANLKIWILLAFASGAIVGMLSFSRLLSWLLRKHYTVTVCILAGCMVGALEKIWPWKETISDVLQRNVLPLQYEQLSGQPSQWGLALAAMVVGIGIMAVVTLIELQMRKK